MTGLQLSEVQQKMYDILFEGKLIRPLQLFRCLPEQDAPLSNIFPHLSGLRKLLHTQGWTILTVRNGKKVEFYQLRQVTSDGRVPDDL